MRNRVFVLALAAVLVSSALLTGCGGPQGTAPEPKKPAVLNLTVDADAKDLNPLVQNDQPSQIVDGLIFAGLTQSDRAGNMVADLAGNWEMSDGGRTFTFHLRKGLKFHDGRPLTADDVVFTWDAAKAPDSLFVVKDQYAKYTAKKLDDTTVQISMKDPNPAFLIDASLPILPQHILGSVPVGDWQKNDFNRKPIGAGPFKFDSWQTGQSITLKAFDDYYAGRPKIDTVVWKVITDRTAAVNALLAGDVDIADLTPDTIAQVKNNDNYTVFRTPALSYMYIGFNLGQRKGKEVPFFKDQRVRQAWAYAIDKQAVIKAAVGNNGQPIEAPFAPVSWAYSQNIKGYEYNPDKAKALLDAAGWKAGPDGIRVKDGVRFDIKLPVRAGQDDRIRAAQTIAAYLEKVGIKVTVTPEDFKSVMLKRLYPPGFDYDVLFMGWALSLNPDVFQLFHSSQIPYVNAKGDVQGGSNYVQYKNPDVDQLISRSQKEMDQAQRKEIFNRIGEIIANDQPYYFLWSPIDNTAVSKAVQGPQPTPFNFYYHVQDWTVNR